MLPVILSTVLEKEMATHSSIPENPLDRGAWWAAVHGVPKSWDTTEHMLPIYISTVQCVQHRNTNLNLYNNLKISIDSFCQAAFK